MALKGLSAGCDWLVSGTDEKPYGVHSPEQTLAEESHIPRYAG